MTFLKTRWPELSLVALIWLLYGRTVGYGFINFDDTNHIVDSWRLQQGLSLDSLWWALTNRDHALWSPTTWISFILEVEFLGGHPQVSHAINILLHSVNALLCLGVAQRLTGSRPLAWLVATAFAVHPMHVEAVVWVIERKEMLAGLFGFLALRAWLIELDRAGEGNPLNWQPAFGWLFLSLASKPMWITLPFLLLLLDFWPLQRLQRPLWMARLREKAPLFLLSGIFLVVGVWAAERSYAVIPLRYNLANAAIAYWVQLRRTLLPVDLSIFYPHPESQVSLLLAFVAALALLGLTVLLWRGASARPWLLVGWLWFAGALFPVSGVVQVSFKAMADRFTYLPHVGLFLGLAVAGYRFREPLRRVLLVLSLILLAFWSVMTWHQAGYWRNSVTLWSQAVENTSPHFYSHHMLGLGHLFAGSYPQALQEFQNGYALLNHMILPFVNARIGQAYFMMGDYRNALYSYNTANGAHPDNPVILLSFVVEAMGLQRFEEARKGLEEILRRLGRDPPISLREQQRLAAETSFQLGVLALRQGRLTEVDAAIRRAWKTLPEKRPGWCQFLRAISQAPLPEGGPGVLEPLLKECEQVVAGADTAPNATR
ncbi:MAG: hypothetical protein HQL56_00885 [Magnetococcales bacterium]|nr:hypothetical protein [Magnetococcales bacterium]